MHSERSWVLQIDDSAYKFLEKVPRKDAERILFILQELPADPFRGDIKKMRGEQNIWRRRVGTYRIRYELIVEEKVIHVFLVERRTSNSY